MEDTAGVGCGCFTAPAANGAGAGFACSTGCMGATVGVAGTVNGKLFSGLAESVEDVSDSEFVFSRGCSADVSVGNFSLF